MFLRHTARLAFALRNHELGKKLKVRNGSEGEGNECDITAETKSEANQEAEEVYA
jgi:hypothetical protein